MPESMEEFKKMKVQVRNTYFRVFLVSSRLSSRFRYRSRNVQSDFPNWKNSNSLFVQIEFRV
jgi:hypothetical protein